MFALSGALGAFFDTFDMGSIEVLSGPQGTLQGRNATGGVVAFNTLAPSMTTPELRTDFQYGNYDTWTAKAAIDGPIVADRFAAKLAAVSTGSPIGGPYLDTFTGTHTGGRKYTLARLSTLFTPTDTLQVAVNVMQVHDQSAQPMGHAVNTDIAYPRLQTGAQGIPTICIVAGVCTPSPPGGNRSNYTVPNWTDDTMVTSNINWNVGPITFTSVSGYRRIKDSTNLDIDFTSVPLIQAENQINTINTWSQEFRAASTDGGGWDFDRHLKWVGGLYFYNNEFYQVSPVCLPALGVPTPCAPSLQGQNLDSYAGFAHADYSLTDEWTVFAGGRETKDKKQFHAEAPAVLAVDGSWSKFTGEAGIRYKFTATDMAYVHFNQGYRAGGINPTGTTYLPESVNDIEIGMKTSSFSNHLTVNGDVFKYNYTNIQRGVVFATTLPPYYQQGTANSAKATIDGAELEIRALPINDLLFGLQVGYLDAHYDVYTDHTVNANGTLTPVDDSALAIPNTPRWTFNTSADYTLRFAAGTLTPHLDYSYKTSYNLNPADIPLGYQGAFGLLNGVLRFTVPSGKYSAAVWVKNWTNKYYITVGDNVGGLANYVVQGLPRTYGVDFTAKLGL